MIASLDIGVTTGFVYGGEIYPAPMELSEIVTPCKDEFQSFEVAKAIEKQLRALKNKAVIKLCLLEGYAYGGGFFNYMQPEITGQVKRYLVTAKIPFVSVPANSMRLAVLGKGNASKMEVRKHIIENYGAASRMSDHIYDAFLGWAFLKLYFTNRLSKEHQEMVKHSIVGGKL